MIKIAAAQYAIEQLHDWKSYVLKIESLVANAKSQGAQLLLLPEYCGLEIVSNVCQTDIELFAKLQPLIPQYLEFYQELARRYEIYLQPGTIVVETSPQRFHNRAYFFGPNEFGYQNKLRLVSSEKESVLDSDLKQTLFKTALGTIGIAICYDSEFPEIVRRLVQQGAMLILVPSYTPSLKSFHRVYFSCRARAIENQCYVLLSCAVKNHQFADSLYELIGQANLFTPIDDGFTDDGILCQGEMNKVMTITDEISYEKIKHIREFGQVHNFKDAQLPVKFLQQEVYIKKL